MPDPSAPETSRTTHAEAESCVWGYGVCASHGLNSGLRDVGAFRQRGFSGRAPRDQSSRFGVARHVRAVQLQPCSKKSAFDTKSLLLAAAATALGALGGGLLLALRPCASRLDELGGAVIALHAILLHLRGEVLRLLMQRCPL